jgi:CheY-like chemotaxis protein
VFLEVADTGRGMDAALAERVWEPFFTTKDAGTGLGLAMVKSFVEQRGGSVSLASKPGEGTTARITLPAVTEAGAPAQQGEARCVRGGCRGRILVVEDDDEVRRVVATILRQVGHDVVAARGPADAVQLAAGAAVPFDLLLTDVVMPDMRGEDLADLLSGRGQVRRIMFMSGYGSPLREAGDPPLVTKPFSAAQLIGTVAALLAPDIEPSPTAATIAPTARVEAHR